MSWRCARCDGLWEDSQTHCDLDGTPRLYTEDEVAAMRTAARRAFDVERAQLEGNHRAAQARWGAERTRLEEALHRHEPPPSPLAPPRQPLLQPRLVLSCALCLVLGVLLGWRLLGQKVLPGGDGPERTAPSPPGNTFLNSLGMKFVLIQPGVFTMGSKDQQADSDEQPVHEVRITKPFYLGIYEVTQGQWQAVMGTNPSHFQGENRPVENVSWEDAQEFIRRLNERERAQGVTYRLSMEAEWEYAARAGTRTAYSFGDDATRLGEYAWYDASAGGQTHPVGQQKPNAWGLYDMHGNVWEWVQDWYGPYTAGAAVDPTGPASGAYRVIRGGSWLGRAGNCRSARRLPGAPSNRPRILGLRLLRMVP